MANPNEKNTIPPASSETVMPTGNENAAAPLGTAVNDNRVEGSEIPVVVIAKKCYVPVAEFEDSDNQEYNILYCPTTGKGMKKRPSSPGQLQPSEVITTAQTRTGSQTSPRRKLYKDGPQARGGAPPTVEDHGEAADQRDPPAVIYKFPWDLNKSPPRDDDYVGDDDDGTVDDIGPGLVA